MICEHDQLKRSCPICDYKAELEDALAQNAQLLQERDEWYKAAKEAQALLEPMQADRMRLLQERDRLRNLINSPETDDWMKGVPIEAAHQAERWSEPDTQKNALDWFWLIGYLAQKAAFEQIAGNTEKAKHHTISTAAALMNWHRYIMAEIKQNYKPATKIGERCKHDILWPHECEECIKELEGSDQANENSKGYLP